MTKEVDKKVESKGVFSNVQTEILLGLSKFMSVKEIASYRKCSRQAVYKAITTLLEKGLVQKNGLTYGLTELGKQGLSSLMGLTNKLRQHNIKVKIEVLESPKNWDKKRNELIRLPYFNKRIELLNNSYDLFNYGKVNIKTTTKSLIISMPTFYSDSIDDVVIQMMDCLYETIPKLERTFKVRLIKDYKANIKIISQEYARLNDALAKNYRKEGEKLYVTDAEGKVWLIADYSFQTDELETIDPNKASDDMTTVHSFMNDLRINPMKLSELKELMTFQYNTIAGLVKTQEVFRENINTHLAVLNKIGDAVTELKEEVKKLRGKNETGANT